MSFFPCAHAGHVVWEYAVRQVVVQLHAQIHMLQGGIRQGLGIVYVSAVYAPYVRDILARLSKDFPNVQHWVGSTCHAVLGGDMDYGHGGALAVMLPGVEHAHYQVFGGVAPWQSAEFVPQSVLLHGDAASPQLPQQLQALQQQFDGALLTGGLCEMQPQQLQWSLGSRAWQGMPMSIGGGGVQMGSVSGVAFSPHVECLTVGMQGCKPVGQAYAITQVDEEVVLKLDGQSALDTLFPHIDWSSALSWPQSEVHQLRRKVRERMVAVLPPGEAVQSSCLSARARVMQVVGIDPVRRGVLLSGRPERGEGMTLCALNAQAIQMDIQRACAELWEVLTAMEDHRGRSIGGAIYIRNHQRQTLLQKPRVDAELQLIRQALGPIPLIGFASSCEVGGSQLQQHSAQLWVFTQPLQEWS